MNIRLLISISVQCLVYLFVLFYLNFINWHHVTVMAPMANGWYVVNMMTWIPDLAWSARFGISGRHSWYQRLEFKYPGNPCVSLGSFLESCESLGWSYRMPWPLLAIRVRSLGLVNSLSIHFFVLILSFFGLFWNNPVSLYSPSFCG